MRILDRTLGVTVVLILCLFVLLIYSSLWRELWYDETVYFALGGLNTVGEALEAVRNTTTNLNQGATGAYMFADYALLKVFGAHTWALRLPSILTGAWLLFSGCFFLRFLGIGPWGITVWPLMLVGQVTLMYYAGEARPYMPLAAAAVGVLAYWSAPVSMRTRWWVRALGWGSVLMGGVFHPYFLPYLISIVCFCTLVWWYTCRSTTGVSLIHFLNLPLLSVGSLLYLLVGALTWMRGTATKVDLDPYQFLSDPLWKAIPAQLFQFVYVERFAVVFSLTTLFISLVALWRRFGWRSVFLACAAPAALILIAVTTAFAISAVSISQNFWILPRQWIASIALGTLGVIWLAVVVVRLLPVRGSRIAVTAVLSGVVLWCALQATITAIEGISADVSRPRMNPAALEVLLDFRRAGVFPEDQVWIDAAQVNMDQGGPVHPVFGDYYRGRDWRTFFLSD